MKTIFFLFKKGVLFLLFALWFNVSQAQDKTASLKSAVAAKQFIFNAQTVFPVSGIARPISVENYAVTVSGDSLISYLPYFGRVYTAPMNSEGGIKFTSTKFDYAIRDRKRGGWEVVIRPQDVSGFREFVLTVSQSGSASLRALSNNRQPISFNGLVEAAE